MAEVVAHDRLKAKARAIRRQFARRLGVELGRLDALTAETLAVYARSKAALSLVDPEQDPERFWRATNACNRALAKLERRLHEVGLDVATVDDPSEALHRHVARNHGNPTQ